MLYELVCLRHGLGAKSQIYIDVAVYSWIGMSGLDRFSRIYEVDLISLGKFCLIIIGMMWVCRLHIIQYLGNIVVC